MDYPTLINVITFEQSLFFDDHDTDEEEDKDLMEKVNNFAEEIVPRFNDRQFKENFRMDPNTFEDLLVKLHSVEEHPLQPGRPRISVEKEALITLWCLSNIQSFRSVASRFGVSKSTCWDVLQVCGFPGVLGCIDGSHIKIVTPKEHGNSYFNRKKIHSVLLQGVCDNQKLFLDVYAGEPGSMHDARLFKKSDLCRRIMENRVEFFNDSHLLGDLAYKLSSYLVVGFKNNGYLTRRQIEFNNKLSQTRVVIENAFGLLKGRFRRLKFMETVRLDLTVLMIVSACILHNICILNGDLPNTVMDVEEEVHQEREINMGMQDDILHQDDRAANLKRQEILNVLLQN